MVRPIKSVWLLCVAVCTLSSPEQHPRVPAGPSLALKYSSWVATWAVLHEQATSLASVAYWPAPPASLPPHTQRPISFQCCMRRCTTLAQWQSGSVLGWASSPQYSVGGGVDQNPHHLSLARVEEWQSIDQRLFLPSHVHHTSAAPPSSLLPSPPFAYRWLPRRRDELCE